MRALRYTTGGEARLARLEDLTVVDAGPAGPLGFVPSSDGWAQIEAADGERLSLGDVSVLYPTEPRKILAIGLNYRDHAEESELEIPAVPVVFAKWASSLVSPERPIVIPREENRPDYEGEVAVILGRDVYRADADQARAAVGGITVLNDVSGRRAQLETPLRQFTLGKSFDTFTPMGPFVQNADGVDLERIAIETRVSGEVMQNSTTANLIFSVVEIIEYLSKGVTLQAGDVIATGTPGGVGDSREPRRYLREGDEVEISVSGVGTLRNPVTLEA